MDAHNTELVQLLNVLAFPTDQTTYAQADSTLQAGLKQPGVYGQLQAISAARELPKEVRLLAALLIGRELPKKWRAKTIVPDELKPEIRQRFFQFFDDEDYQIARAQLRTLVTIARQEYPRTWTNLPADLLQPLTSSFAHVSSHSTGDLNDPERNRQKVILLNSLWTWNAFVKEWRSVKLPVGQKLMAEFIHSLRTPMYQYLDFFMARDPVLEDWELMESARYCFKICARLAEWEFSRPIEKRVDNDPSRITQLVTNSLGYLSTLQTIRLQLLSSPFYTTSGQAKPTPSSAPARMLKSLTKFIRVVGKTYEALMHIDPKTFVSIPGTVGAVGWWWGEVANAVRRGEMPEDEDETAKYPKRFMLLGLILFKNILPTLSSDHTEIFTNQFITDAFDLLIDNLLPLSEADWENWNDGPEEWLVDSLDATQAWSYDFRPCAERVLMSLTAAARGKDVTESLLLQKLGTALGSPADSFEKRVKQDAVLCATGRMSRALMDRIKLDQILALLAPTIGSNESEDRIIKARTAWLIGHWVTSDEDSARLPAVWQMLLHLLTVRGEASDLAVTISAAMALKECIDLWELEISVFEHLIGQIAHELLKAISEAQTLSGKRAILDCLTVLIDRVGDKMMPYADNISAAIPQLWSAAADLDGEWLFKASLVLMASKLVAAAKASTLTMLPLIVPLIEESLTGPAKEHFEEDGMVLWQVAIRAVPSLSMADESGLARLFPGLLNLLTENMDVLRNTVTLMESYMLLAGEEIMQMFGEHVIRAYASALEQAPKESTRMLLESLDVALQVTSPNTWISPLIKTGLAQKACHIIDDPKTGGPELAAYDAFLARVILREPTAFATFVTAYAQTQVTANAVAKQLELTIDAMWRAYEYVGDAKRRKMVAMAFANLLLLGEGAVYEHMEGEFANAWLDTLGEIKEKSGSNNEITRNWQEDQGLLASDLEGTEEYSRRTALSAVDPVYSEMLKSYIAERLTRAQSLGMSPYWERLDLGVKDSLTKFLS